MKMARLKTGLYLVATEVLGAVKQLISPGQEGIAIILALQMCNSGTDADRKPGFVKDKGGFSNLQPNLVGDQGGGFGIGAVQYQYKFFATIAK